MSVSESNRWPRGEQLALQLLVVLDDAVVDDREPTLAVEVRVRVGLGDAAVGRPAGVPEAAWLPGSCVSA